MKGFQKTGSEAASRQLTLAEAGSKRPKLMSAWANEFTTKLQTDLLHFLKHCDGRWKAFIYQPDEWNVNWNNKETINVIIKRFC